MIFNKPDNAPEDENDILIAIVGENKFIGGWYDQGEGEYYSHDGDMIIIDHVKGWCLEPTVSFL